MEQVKFETTLHPMDEEDVDICSECVLDTFDAPQCNNIFKAIVGYSCTAVVRIEGQPYWSILVKIEEIKINSNVTTVTEE